MCGAGEGGIAYPPPQLCNAPRLSLAVPTQGDRHAFVKSLRWVPIAGFSQEEMGSTPVAAFIYSLIESAKLYGVEPRAYLRDATPRAVRNPGTVTLARDLKSPKFREKSGG